MINHKIPMALSFRNLSKQQFLKHHFLLSIKNVHFANSILVNCTGTPGRIFGNFTHVIVTPVVRELIKYRNLKKLLPCLAITIIYIQHIKMNITWSLSHLKEPINGHSRPERYLLTNQGRGRHGRRTKMSGLKGKTTTWALPRNWHATLFITTLNNVFLSLQTLKLIACYIMVGWRRNSSATIFSPN